MDKRTRNIVVGFIFLMTSLAFFIMPLLLSLESFIPVMLAFVSFIALISHFTGYSEK